MATQVWPLKAGALVDQKDVYEGGLGAGFIDTKYKVTGTDMQILLIQAGPEARNIPSGWNLYASEDATKPSGWATDGLDNQFAADIKKVMDGTHIWVQDIGVEAV